MGRWNDSMFPRIIFFLFDGDFSEKKKRKERKISHNCSYLDSKALKDSATLGHKNTVLWELQRQKQGEMNFQARLIDLNSVAIPDST